MSSLDGVLIRGFHSFSSFIHTVMNISLGETNTSISEGIGFYEVRLLKSEGALGPVTVTLFTISGSATGLLEFHSSNNRKLP